MKKEFIIPIIVIILTIAFATASFLVFASKGNKFFISKKLKIGALLLTLTSFSLVGQDRATMLCYRISYPKNSIFYSENQGQSYNKPLKLKKHKRIKLQIENRTETGFSFLLADTSNIELQRGDIIPSDGKFDKNNEKAYISLDKNLKTGQYVLYFFVCKKEDIKMDSVNSEYHIFIKN